MITVDNDDDDNDDDDNVDDGIENDHNDGNDDGDNNDDNDGNNDDKTNVKCIKYDNWQGQVALNVKMGTVVTHLVCPGDKVGK